MTQFPGGQGDLPAGLLERMDSRFRIEWVDGDIGPHKKYFYAMQRYPEALIVTVDDDAVYGETLLRTLYETHLEYPHAVVCDRANLILFRPNGSLREYDAWIYDYGHLRGVQTYQLLPTGVGGVLYPPGSLPSEAFDLDAIVATSPRADDLWLKFMTTAHGFPAVMPRVRSGHTLIDDAQTAGLWRANAFQGGNDAAIELIERHFDESLGGLEPILRRIRGVGDGGEFWGPRTTDFAPLL